VIGMSDKYGRTYHFSFSPGATNDDKINQNWWEDLKRIKQVVITEKLDGQNNCLNASGIYARSHIDQSNYPWDKYLRDEWLYFKDQLGDLELFGENLYAIHSIKYLKLEDYFYQFAVRNKDRWLSWDEVNTYAAMLNFKTVPFIDTWSYNPKLNDHKQKLEFQKLIESISKQSSTFLSVDILTNKSCSMEGVVVRNIDCFSIDSFSHNVFKFVRAYHVTTDEHWTKNWKKASLLYETK
jgi:hypothetical protein